MKKQPNLLESCQPGQRTLVDLDVGALPSGTPIKIRAHVIRAAKPGPTALLLGGVHGDEINGIEIVRRAVSSGILRHLKCGAVIAIPLLNVYGFLNYSRDVPDGKDVNRSFPGNRNGSLASRVAHVISKQVLPIIDFGIDFHTGGWAHHNHPQIRYSPKDPAATVLAKAFNAPVTLASSTIPKSLRNTALEMDKPMIIFEGGENLRLHGTSIDTALQGIRNVLVSHDMINVDSAFAKTDSISLNNSSGTRATNAVLLA